MIEHPRILEQNMTGDTIDTDHCKATRENKNVENEWRIMPTNNHVRILITAHETKRAHYVE